jgi:hypothetical protein
MGLAACSKDIIISPHNSSNTERGSPSPALRTGGDLVGRGIANPQKCLLAADFKNYLKSQNRRNIKQIVSYAQRYNNILETGDTTPLVNLSSGAMRRHAMEALTTLSKYRGTYDNWYQTRKRYSLKWTNGNKAIQGLQRFFNDDNSLENMLQ